MIPRLLEVAVGVWLMVAPAVLGYGPPAAHSDRVAGPILIATAIVAAWEIARPLRHLNLLLGVWLIVAPLVLGAPFEPLLNSMGCGFAAILLSRLGGQRASDFGGGWRSLWPPGREVGERQREVYGSDESLPGKGRPGRR